MGSWRGLRAMANSTFGFLEHFTFLCFSLIVVVFLTLLSSCLSLLSFWVVFVFFLLRLRYYYCCFYL